MRIWSLHPKYIDAKGIVALWRETLLAKHVLEGKTKGYKNHPQLHRFRKLDSPLDGINFYLSVVFDEAKRRGYNFNGDKINWSFEPVYMDVTNGQLDFERSHLLSKLLKRNKTMYREISNEWNLQPHPIFLKVEGDVEDWEKL